MISSGVYLSYVVAILLGIADSGFNTQVSFLSLSPFFLVFLVFLVFILLFSRFSRFIFFFLIMNRFMLLWVLCFLIVWKLLLEACLTFFFFFSLFIFFLFLHFLSLLLCVHFLNFIVAFKFFQAGSTAVLFFVGPYVSHTFYFIVVLITLWSGTLFFFVLDAITPKSPKKDVGQINT